MYLDDLIFFCFFYIILLGICIPCYSVSDGCLEEGSPIIDGQSTLISPGGVFELGFFSPEHNSPKSRYLGIWYYDLSNPKIVVWVANGDKPLLGTDGSLVIDGGNASVSDSKGTTYWIAGSGLSARLCLEDSGNLVLHGSGQDDQILWQSFNQPTDTFLPGMNAVGGNFNLTSWQAPNNPAKGHYAFIFQQVNNENKLCIKREGWAHYWDSSITPFDQPPQQLLFLLLKDEPHLKDYNNNNNTRLLMNLTGQIQFWRRDIKRGDWSLLWSEPNDKCDLFEACGVLGSCNSKNGLLCKCLPGAVIGAQQHWNSGNFGDGCVLKSQPCHRRYWEDVFLRMPMMKVKAPKTNDTNIEDCETQCRNDETCLAYSCGVTDCNAIAKSNEKSCLIWSNNELTNLQEDYPTGGLTIFFRTTNSDIGLTPKGCKPCGTYIIPYPLSTTVNCGDSLYLNFKCNTTSGQVSFSTSNLTYKVTSLDPVAKKFTIQVGHGNSCGSKSIHSLALLLKYSLYYHFGKCNVVKDQSSLVLEQSFVEVEIGWKPPPEPACNKSSDCQNWLHTTCKAARHGKMRCICGSMYHWDGDLLKCKVTFIKVLALGIAGALVVLCGIFLIYYVRRIKRIHIQRSIEFEGDNTESMDVPFFSWEIILAATDNFAGVNKLGTGGFGSVYRGKLSDGQDIAVKRLSTASMQGLEEFKTEVKLIAKLQHRNLVRLIGYCVKGDERILVYEYMPNGSLDSCLFDDEHPVHLNWKERFDVILALARGLLYLHQDSRLRIIHRDLKPSNILLDKELNPKISDFGIARTVEEKETQAKTARVIGTYGYMSPEYAYDGIFSIKSDVFSFGVVVLETISGRRNSKFFMFEHGTSLLGHAWKLWNEDKALELIDPKLKESCLPTEVQKCIHIGLLCVQEDPSDRPTMSTVVYMLSFETALPPAKQPAFMNRKPLSESASSSGVNNLGMLQEVLTVPVVGR